VSNPVQTRLDLWRVTGGLTKGQQWAAYAAIGVGVYGIFELFRGRMALGATGLAIGAGGSLYLYTKKQEARERAQTLAEYLSAQSARIEANDGNNPEDVKATATGWSMGGSTARGATVAQWRLDADREAAIAAANA
jgi:hypothetical protein